MSVSAREAFVDLLRADFNHLFPASYYSHGLGYTNGPPAFRSLDPRVSIPAYGFHIWLLKPIRTHADNSDKYMDIKELSETALLDHAMTSKKRSKAIEEFLKLTFKSQVDSNCCHEDLVNLGLFLFQFSLTSPFIRGLVSTNQNVEWNQKSKIWWLWANSNRTRRNIWPVE